MALEQQDSRFNPKDLGILASELDNPEDDAAKGSGLASIFRRPRRYLLGLTFAAGLLLGWLVIGWWLWPVQWTNTAPWHLGREHQKTYISLVAQNYWWTKELKQTRDALAGWDDEALAELLATMEREASSAEERQQLTLLAEVLEVPTPEESFWAAILSQKVILFSSILSALPLTAAIVLAISSLVQNRTRPSEELLAEEEQLEETLEVQDQEVTPGGELDQAREEQQEEQAEKKEAAAEEEEEASYEEDEEEEEEEEPWVQDLVSVLFDEEDTEVSELEALCKRLPDIDASDLLEDSRKIAAQLQRGNSLR